MRVSVVVPAWNEEVLLSACLRALRCQDFKGEVEVIVVDNASTDLTGSIAEQEGVIVVFEAARGYANAIARGFAMATGEIIASTDADTVVPPDWLSRLVEAYRADVVAVGGEIEFWRPNWRARLLTRGLLPWLNRIDRRNPLGPHLWGANFSVRRSAYLAAGGWNPNFNLQTDTEFSERLRRFGRVLLLEDLAVRTSCRRWNRALAVSCFLYATNFISLELRKRPLWWGFPDIREGVGSVGAGLHGGSRARAWPRVRAWSVAALVVFVACFGVYDAVSPWSNAFGITHWNGATDEKVVALTFDDGPNEPYTSQVLRILNRENVHATFFSSGRTSGAIGIAPRASSKMGTLSGTTRIGTTWDSRSSLGPSSPRISIAPKRPFTTPRASIRRSFDLRRESDPHGS